MTNEIQVKSLEEAIVLATIQSTVNYVAVAHQIPVNHVVHGMSISRDVTPMVNAAIQNWKKKAAENTPAPAPPPEPPKPKPVPKPVTIPQPAPQPQPVTILQSPGAYAMQAIKGSVKAVEDGPLPIPSTFSATESQQQETKIAYVPSEVIQEFKEAAKQEPKKRGPKPKPRD